MTGRLETLIYTDCRPGQGLEGGPGLQFQSKSAGIDEQAMTVVRANLLYEPPTQLVRQRRPVSEFPPSLVHFSDGVFATAAGIYLGKEVNGNRDGNQLTHCVLSSDPEAYGRVRPAQLFGARFWMSAPAASNTLDPIEPEWSPGPLSAERVQRFVLEHNIGPELLTALLSAVEATARQPGSAPRLLIIADDLTEVMSWIAAATLLLPQRIALDVGFRAFAASPTFARQQVVAVYAEDSVDISVDNNMGYAVFDLVRGRWTAAEPSAYARQWSRLFLAEDPYDVVDAVEFAAVSGLRQAEAMAVAMVAITGRRPDREQAEQVVGWLRQGSADLVRAYGAQVTSVLLRSTGFDRLNMLRGLDEASARDMVGDQAVAVRHALLRAELAEAMTSQQVLPEQVAPARGGWSAADSSAATNLLKEAACTAKPVQFEALLRLCRRFGLRLPFADLDAEVHAFVLDWADHQRAYQSQGWMHRTELEKELLKILHERMDADPANARRIAKQWSQILMADVSERGDRAAAIAVDARLHDLTGSERLREIRSLLREANLALTDRFTALRRVTALIWQQESPTAAEVAVLKEMLPRGLALPPEIFAPLGRRLLHKPKLAVEDLAVAHEVFAAGFWPAAPLEVDTLLGADLRLLNVDRQLQHRDPSVTVIRSAAPIPARLAQAHRNELLNQLGNATSAAAVYATLQVVPSLTQAFVLDLEAFVRKQQMTSPRLAVAFVLATPDLLEPAVVQEISSEHREYFMNTVKVFAQRSSQKRLDTVTGQMHVLGDPWEKAWKAMAVQVRRPGWRRLLGP
jgi:hypothetical protein